MTAVLWDSWAFIESALDGPRSLDVEALLDGAEGVVTTHHVVAETFTYLSREARSSRPAVAWWNDLRESRVRVIETSLEDIHAFASALKQVGTLSFVDLSLGTTAKTLGVRAVATADREFRRMRLDPLFAKP
ncbi:MAG: type II toxin-antitoxin system VapC family toxin [Candidatus Thermoplasmatota archaeon]